MIMSKTLWQRGALILLAVGIFIAGFYFRAWYRETIDFRLISKVYTPSEVTTAITDRWEMQLTDRTTGEVRIYNQDVLNAIFYQYQARRAYTQEDKIGE